MKAEATNHFFQRESKHMARPPQTGVRTCRVLAPCSSNASLSPDSAFGERHVLRNSPVQVMADHKHIQVLIDGVLGVRPFKGRELRRKQPRASANNRGYRRVTVIVPTPRTQKWNHESPCLTTDSCRQATTARVDREGKHRWKEAGNGTFVGNTTPQ